MVTNTAAGGEDHTVMRNFPAIATVAALAALVGLPVHAADEPFLIDIAEVPEHVPIEIESGWYLRGDIVHRLNDAVYDGPLFGEDVSNTPLGGGVGVGYRFNDLLRAELNFGFIGQDRLDYSDGGTAALLEYDLWSGMLNGYLDLGTVVGFTPFVGAGAGLVYASHEASVVGPGLNFSSGGSQYEFAYTLGAGVNYRFTDTVSVDVGYQYLSAPGLEHIDLEAAEIRRGLDHHQVRIGLRFDLW